MDSNCFGIKSVPVINDFEVKHRIYYLLKVLKLKDISVYKILLSIQVYQRIYRFRNSIENKVFYFVNQHSVVAQVFIHRLCL